MANKNIDERQLQIQNKKLQIQIHATTLKGTYFDTKRAKPYHAKGGGGGDHSPNQIQKSKYNCYLLVQVKLLKEYKKGETIACQRWRWRR